MIPYRNSSDHLHSWFVVATTCLCLCAGSSARVLAADATVNTLHPSDLVPEVSVLFEPNPVENWYLEILDQLLIRRKAGERLCGQVQMVAEEDGQERRPEWSVQITGGEGGKQVLARRAKGSLNQMLLSALDAEAGNQRQLVVESVCTKAKDLIEEARAPLSRDESDLLEQIWTAMLDRVRYPSPDEAKSYFHPRNVRVVNCSVADGVRSGKAIARVGLAGDLVSVGFAMRDYAFGAEKNKKGLKQTLMLRAERLMNKLKQLGYRPRHSGQIRSGGAGLVESPIPQKAKRP